MQISSKSSFDFKDLNETYYKLLKEEDFNFKNKNIKIEIKLEDELIFNIECDTILDLKIASSALIKSLETINKTLTI